MENRSPLYIPGEAFEDCACDLLIYAFFSGVDAGEIGTMSIDQLLHALPHERVATFQIDDNFDYRSRRPRIQIENWVLSQMQEPYCAIDKVTDYTGNTFLVMHGVEPDTGWQQIAQSTVEIMQKAGVKKAYDLLGVASNVPHTRQSFLNLIAPQGTYLPEQKHLSGNFMVNSSFGQYLQMALAKVEIKSQGLLLAVPYYLADAQYPPGAVVMLEYLTKELHLDLPIGDLEAASARMHKDINKQVENSVEVQEMLAVMEKQYDDSQHLPQGHPAKDGPAAFLTPDGEKLAAKLEQFLQNVELSQANERSATNSDTPNKQHKTLMVPPAVVNPLSTVKTQRNSAITGPRNERSAPAPNSGSVQSENQSGQRQTRSQRNQQLNSKQANPAGTDQSANFMSAELILSAKRSGRRRKNISKASKYPSRVGKNSRLPETGKQAERTEENAGRRSRSSRYAVRPQNETTVSPVLLAGSHSRPVSAQEQHSSRLARVHGYWSKTEKETEDQRNNRASITANDDQGVTKSVSLPIKDRSAAAKRLHDFLNQLYAPVEDCERQEKKFVVPPAPSAPSVDSIPSQLRFPSRRSRGYNTTTDPAINFRTGELPDQRSK